MHESNTEKYNPKVQMMGGERKRGQLPLGPIGQDRKEIEANLRWPVFSLGFILPEYWGEAVTFVQTSRLVAAR